MGKSTLYRAQIWGRVYQNHQGKVITLFVKYSPLSNPPQILGYLRFLIGDKISFFNYTRLYCLNLSQFADITLKDFASQVINIEEHHHRDAQDTRNIQHFFRLGVTPGLENTCLAEMGSNGLLLQIGLRSKDTLRV